MNPNRGNTPARLTPQQERFVAEYLKYLDATKAARLADYSSRHAASIGCNLLKLPHVAAAIKRAMESRARRTRITQDRILRQIARIAFSDVRAIFDEHGQLRNPADLDDDDAAAIASIDVVERPSTSVKGETSIEYLHKIKLVDKIAALTLLARHLGMFNDKLNATARLTDASESPLEPALIHRVEELLRRVEA